MRLKLCNAIKHPTLRYVRIKTKRNGRIHVTCMAETALDMCPKFSIAEIAETKILQRITENLK